MPRCSRFVLALNSNKEHETKQRDNAKKYDRGRILLTCLDVLCEESAIQHILQLHDHLGIFYRLEFLVHFFPNNLVKLVGQDELHAPGEANLVDRPPWLLLGGWLAAIDISGKRAKCRPDLGVGPRILLAQEVKHLDVHSD